MNTTKSRFDARKMVLLAMFCALAYVCQFVFRIKISFLTFDAKDAVMAVGAMIFGPISGLAMSLIVAFLEFITISDTGIYGFIMNFISSASFVAVSALVYKHKRTLTGAIAGLCTGCAAMTVVMLAFNLVITPLYVPSFTASDVAALIPTLLLPFNLTKALLNAGLVLILYRPVTIALRKAHVLQASSASSMTFDKKSVAVLVGGLALVAVCVTVFLVLMNGTFQLHK